MQHYIRRSVSKLLLQLLFSVNFALSMFCRFYWNVTAWRTQPDIFSLISKAASTQESKHFYHSHCFIIKNKKKRKRNKITHPQHAVGGGWFYQHISVAGLQKFSPIYCVLVWRSWVGVGAVPPPKVPGPQNGVIQDNDGRQRRKADRVDGLSKHNVDLGEKQSKHKDKHTHCEMLILLF